MIKEVIWISTLNNYAYHLGNHYEHWMMDEFNKIKKSVNSKIILNQLSEAKPINKLSYTLGKLFHKLYFSKFKRIYFNYKGMKSPY